MEQTFHRALALASERRHGRATPEHLLLALVDDPDAVTVMRACCVEVDALRREFVERVDADPSDLIDEGRQEAKPNSEFQDVIQHAVIQVQLSGRDEVTGADVLLAIVRDPKAPAAVLLAELGLTTYDATRFAAHGIKKDSVAKHSQSGIAIGGGLVRIVMKNDEFTPMEFVVDLLRDTFGMSQDVAVRTMMVVHSEGYGGCGNFPPGLAKTKVDSVHVRARQHQHPLLCLLEAS